MPVSQLIYSHSHADHASGGEVLSGLQAGKSVEQLQAEHTSDGYTNWLGYDNWREANIVGTTRSLMASGQSTKFSNLLPAIQHFIL